MCSEIRNEQRKRRGTRTKRTAWTILTAIFACLCLAVYASAAQKKAATAASFTVKPVQKSCSVGEAVLLLLGLRNTGQRTIVVDGNFALGRTVQVSVTGPQGKSIDWQAAFPKRTTEFQTLEPGDSVTRVVCLNCRSLDPFTYPFAKTGTYTVRMKYEPSGLTPAQRSRFPQAVALGQAIEAAPFELKVTPAALQFTAEPEHPTFQLGNPIRFVFHLRNTSKQGVLAAYDLPLLDAVRMKVVDANGKEVPWSGKQHSTVPLLSTIDAGGSVESSYEITPQNLFGNVLRDLDIRKPGTYTAYAVYDLSEPIDELQGYVGMMSIQLIPGPIAAPPVKFTVLPAPSEKKK